MTTKELIENHISYAKSLARKKHKKACKVPYDDLLSAAYEGLCCAAKTFDSTKKVSFATHAYKRIMGCMDEYIEFLLETNNDISIDGELDIEEGFVQETDASGLVNRLVAILPPIGERMLRLYYLENLDTKKIGEEMGLAPTSICVRLSQYRSYLRNEWRDKRHLLFEG